MTVHLDLDEVESREGHFKKDIIRIYIYTIIMILFYDLCDLPRSQVEPLFARQLLYYAQQMGGHYFRSYEHPGVTDHINTAEDYQRTITHHHSSSLQEWSHEAQVAVENLKTLRWPLTRDTRWLCQEDKLYRPTWRLWPRRDSDRLPWRVLCVCLSAFVAGTKLAMLLLSLLTIFLWHHFWWLHTYYAKKTDSLCDCKEENCGWIWMP